ncbi:MAG: NAD(P)H-dependent oxidoreductase [Ferruginibacter sp.]
MRVKVIAFSGSLRKESYTTKLIKAFQKSAPADITVELIDISKLPFINEDLETDLPQTIKDLHSKIKSADAILFATPEYNRSYSPVLKNAIDWGSRPEGKNMWDKKPAGVIGCSPYSLGGFGAVNHLRQVMLYVNLQTMQQPEFYLAEIANSMDDKGNINKKETQDFIDTFWTAFEQWIKNFIS